MSSLKASFFKTASGKEIVISQKAIDEAEKKMITSEAEEASLALSQTFLPQSMSRSKGNSGSDEASPGASSALSNWSPEEVVTFRVKRIYPPAYQLRDKKYLISERAYGEMKQKQNARVEGMAGPDIWTLSRMELEQQTSKQIDVPQEDGDSQVFKITGTNDSGGFVRVLVWDKHGRIHLEVGKSYYLCGFNKIAKANVLELRSSENICVIPLSCNPANVTPEPPLKIRQILQKAHSVTSGIETDLVAKVVEKKMESNGMNVLVRDVTGDEIKIKFMYAAEVEGVESMVVPGNVIAFTGLMIHHPITKLHGYLFSNEFTDYFNGETIPAHLRNDFMLFDYSELEEMDCDEVLAGAKKRPTSTEDSGPSPKMPRYK